MGRHVNHQDAQDRIMTRFSKTAKSMSLEERDPDSLTLAEQFELAKQRRKERPEPVPKKNITRFSGRN